MKITQENQPLFVVKVGQMICHLPTEFCLVDGVPDYIKASPKMRIARSHTLTEPAKKLEKIQNFVSAMAKQNSTREWDFSIDLQRVEVKARVLPPPEMYIGKKVLKCEDF